MSVSGRVQSLKDNKKSLQTNPRGANPRLCCLHCLRFSQAPWVKGFTAEKIWTISESQTWYLAGLGLLNGINKYIQHDGIYTNIHNYKHIITFSAVLFMVFSSLSTAEQWHLRWQPWHTYLHDPNSWESVVGNWVFFTHSKTKEYVWYLVTIPSAPKHVRTSWSTGPSSTRLPKDFLPTVCGKSCLKPLRMGWQFVSRTIPCNCAIWMHRCCKMSIGFISLPY